MINVNCQNNQTCQNSRVDAMCVDGCCCTVPRVENATGDIPLTVPAVAQPLRDSPPQQQKSLASNMQQPLFYAIIPVLFAMFAK